MRGWILAVFLIGCGFPDPNPDKPASPEANDPAFTINGLHTWNLIGDALTPDAGTMTVIITAPPGTKYVDAYVGDLPPVRMDQQDNGFGMIVPISDVAAGAYDVRFSANSSDTAFAQVPWYRSAPYYVMVSTDYDFSDPGDIAIADMNTMHQQHPEMRITHFWAPYTYTDPTVTADRQATLDTWIHMERDMFHDEIGLHIHPYCNFVTDAGLACITDQSDVYPAGDTSGYTIILASYPEDQMETLLQHAIDLFAQHGIDRPATFRAGGWTADVSTVTAEQAKGFAADSSAINWARLVSWKGYVIYDWTMEHWAPIDDTSQPYYPSQTDLSMTTPGNNFPLLEVPINGVMIDYVSTDEMTMIFDENWDQSAPLSAPSVLMMGFHPSTNFDGAEYQRVEDFLTLADKHANYQDLGPVVYTTLSDLITVFPAQ
jgi:hypothetical protein